MRDNYFNMKRFLAILLVISLLLLTGCSYGCIVTLPEQIAIYQNMGFICVPLTSNIDIDDNRLNLNNLEEINLHLQNNSVQSTVRSASVLYLQDAEFSGKLAGLLFIYYFETDDAANNFYQYFLANYLDSIYLYGCQVLQKGSSSLIVSNGQNTHYYLSFISGLKKIK